jgi:hypothetical protein
VLATIGYILLAISGVNLYHGVGRWLVAKWLGRPIRHISGIPLFGTLFLVLALLLIPLNRWTVFAAALICSLDTLGLPYLLGVMAWQYLRSKPSDSK